MNAHTCILGRGFPGYKYTSTRALVECGGVNQVGGGKLEFGIMVWYMCGYRYILGLYLLFDAIVYIVEVHKEYRRG